MKHFKDEKFFSAYVIGASILVGAVLVSASVFYNARIIMNKLNSFSGGDTVQAAQGQAPTANNGDTVKNVAIRSDSPVLGNKNAKVTMIEYSDFQCPFSKSYFQNSFDQLKKEYVDTGKMKIVFQNFPLPFHINAEKAAEAAECANKQGKFWQYHDLLFTNGQSDGTGLDTASLKSYASQLGLDTQKFNSCLDNGEAVAAVKSDLANAQAVGVQGTPTFLINGVSTVGALPVTSFEQAINAALK